MHFKRQSKVLFSLESVAITDIIMNMFIFFFITFSFLDRKSTRLNSSHQIISYAVFCLNPPSTPHLYTLSLHDALPIFTRLSEERTVEFVDLLTEVRTKEPARHAL